MAFFLVRVDHVADAFLASLGAVVARGDIIIVIILCSSSRERVAVISG